MDYDPQLCYKTDNVSFVSKENIVGYKQSTPHRFCCCCYSRRFRSSSWEPTVVLPSLKANNIFDNAAGVKSSPISTYTDLVVPVCEESASISISGLCEVNSTCSNIIDGYELVSQRYRSRSEVDSAAAAIAVPFHIMLLPYRHVQI